MSNAIGRRKFITIAAAATGAALLSRVHPWGGPARAAQPVTWSGSWLGSAVGITIHDPDAARAARAIRQVTAHAAQMEGFVSLYRPDSLVNELNRTGVLAAPPAHLVELLQLCDDAWTETAGRFDATVQPLWQCYRAHFTRAGPAADAPPAGELARALARTGWPRVRFDRNRVVLARGMALTLNGIAQGYMTDRAVAVLRAAGFENCLVNMGEIRGLGVRADGRPWQVAVAGGGAEPLPLDEDITRDKAVATSQAQGFAFNHDGSCNHLFDPATGLCAPSNRSLTVVADSAARADALSTALSLVDDAAIAAMLPGIAGVRVFASSGTALAEIRAAAG